MTYDFLVVSCFILSGVYFLLGAKKKLPNKVQLVFDTVLPWSKWVPIVFAAALFFNAINYGYGAFQ